ncbi:DUF2218 domain-containing protein [Roseomonas xinghualingensis]|uniref:DUF2218 domain-containing protein n=1 Tax=Roseomonas xinghualingensis TaxID=2986475 RepID=UPI0021F1C4D5|nr:siderophore-interacting protein [Roseomonas sp. SXEYE001]MCV4208423.1 siderophore-interacting protein [Roseomonas sp. SXEYE001]
MTLIAEARATSRAPEALLAHFRDHMLDHGLEVTGALEDTRINNGGTIALLKLRQGGIDLRIEAPSIDKLADTKIMVAGHLNGLAEDETLGIVWTGDGAIASGDARPHNFRLSRVVSARDITPRMRRVTIQGEGFDRFAGENHHLKILMPQGPGEPAWPRLTPSGVPQFDSTVLIRRTYTIRRLDLAAGEMDIDFVLHGDTSPGPRFALRAQPGDWLGLMGPGGGSVKADGWTLLGGDETALPAIARGLEAMPRDAQGLALIEVADAAEEQAIDAPPGLPVRWLHRNGAPYGEKLLEAMRGAEYRPVEQVSAWAACENATARSIREHWMQERKLTRGRYRAVGYWRQGAGEDDEEH